MKTILKKFSAWVPIALSLVMLATILTIISSTGVPAPQPEADEGAGAHLFQIWLVVEVVLIAFFAVTWLPRQPKQALVVLALQIAAVLAGCAPVFLLHL